MKRLIVIISIFICNALDSSCQESIKKQSISFYSGIILEDGFYYKRSFPIIGLGYSYKLNKYLSLEAGLVSIYKVQQDPTWWNSGEESFNIILRNTSSLFISQEDRDKITNVGIKDLYSENTVKYLYLPLSLSINIHPLIFGRSKIGFCLGATATYASYKASRDRSPIDIVLNDGTILNNIKFQQEIEFRNLLIGGSYSKLYYKYEIGALKKNAIQLSIHSYNFFWSYNNTETYHILSLDFCSFF